MFECMPADKRHICRVQWTILYTLYLTTELAIYSRVTIDTQTYMPAMCSLSIPAALLYTSLCYCVHQMLFTMVRKDVHLMMVSVMGGY